MDKIPTKITLDFPSNILKKKVLHLTIKATKTCCSIIIEPKIEILGVDKAQRLRETTKTNYDLIDLQGIKIIIDRVLFKIYPSVKNVTIRTRGLFRNRLVCDLPALMLSKESNEYDYIIKQVI